MITSDLAIPVRFLAGTHLVGGNCSSSLSVFVLYSGLYTVRKLARNLGLGDVCISVI
jgi:hypothetical protein